MWCTVAFLDFNYLQHAAWEGWGLGWGGGVGGGVPVVLHQKCHLLVYRLFRTSSCEVSQLMSQSQSSSALHRSKVTQSCSE